MFGTGFGLLADFPSTHSSCLLESWDYGQGTKERGSEIVCQREKDTQYTVSLDHLQSASHGAPIRRCRVFGVSCWLTWKSECKRPLGRPLVLLCRSPQVISGKESLADGRGCARRRPRSIGRNINYWKQAYYLTKFLQLVLFAINWFKTLMNEYHWKPISCVKIVFWYV